MDYFFLPPLPTDMASPLPIDFGVGASDTRVVLGAAPLPPSLEIVWFFDFGVLRLLTPLRPILPPAYLLVLSRPARSCRGTEIFTLSACEFISFALNMLTAFSASSWLLIVTKANPLGVPFWRFTTTSTASTLPASLNIERKS